MGDKILKVLYFTRKKQDHVEVIFSSGFEPMSIGNHSKYLLENPGVETLARIHIEKQIKIKPIEIKEYSFEFHRFIKNKEFLDPETCSFKFYELCSDTNEAYIRTSCHKNFHLHINVYEKIRFCPFCGRTRMDEPV